MKGHIGVVAQCSFPKFRISYGELKKKNTVKTTYSEQMRIAYCVASDCMVPITHARMLPTESSSVAKDSTEPISPRVMTHKESLNQLQNHISVVLPS